MDILRCVIRQSVIGETVVLSDSFRETLTGERRLVNCQGLSYYVIN